MLYRSIQHGHKEVFEELCTPDMIYKDSIFMEQSLLETIIKYERRENINIIISRLMEDDEESWTRLMDMARKNQDNNIITIIETRQKDLKSYREDGYNPLHIAASEKDIVMVEYILEHTDVDKEGEDKKGQRAIHIAAEKGLDNILKMIIDNECDIECLTKDKKTPLDLASENKDEMCILLLETSVTNRKNTMLTKKGRFELKVPHVENKDFLGRGGFGDVYKYEYKDIQQTFAIKKFSFNLNLKNKSQRIELEKEISIHSILKSHRNIVNYFGCVWSENAMYIYLEYINGGSLKQYLNKNGPLMPTKTAFYSKQLLQGLDFIHQKQILHRDIKGDNILIDEDDCVKLCDFGLSKMLSTIEEGAPANRVTKSTCGTPFYMAPEVLLGEEYSFGADVWSMGATVIEMITGEHPYPNLEQNQAMYKIGTTRKLEYDPPFKMPKELKHFIANMTMPEGRDRATVKDLLKSKFILEFPDIETSSNDPGSSSSIVDSLSEPSSSSNLTNVTEIRDTYNLKGNLENNSD